MLIRPFLSALLFAVIAFVPAAAAFEFSPIVAQFAPTGSGSAKTFIVRNTHQEPVALQIEIFSRSADEFGNETREPEYDDFIATPPQMVLLPGQSQSIRVQWVGESNPTKELSYRLVVEQLPIPYKKEGNADGVAVDVQLGFRYEAALYVVPSSGEPEAVLTNSEIVKTDDGNTVLRLTIKNLGARRAILQRPVLSFTAGGTNYELAGEEVEMVNNRNIIAGTQAVIDVPVDSSLAAGPVSATLKTDYFRN